MLFLAFICISPQWEQPLEMEVPTAKGPPLLEINTVLEGNPFLLLPDTNVNKCTIPDYMLFDPDAPTKEKAKEENNIESTPSATPVQERAETSAYAVTDSDIYILAQMLAGECYDFNLEDQRNAAIVVCNRVDCMTDGFQNYNTIASVIKYTGFYAYSAYNVPSANNLQIATEVLEDYALRTAGQEISRPWHNYLYFHGNGTHSNVYT